jgi:hypothetical protein
MHLSPCEDDPHRGAPLPSRRPSIGRIGLCRKCGMPDVKNKRNAANKGMEVRNRSAPTEAARGGVGVQGHEAKTVPQLMRVRNTQEATRRSTKNQKYALVLEVVLDDQFTDRSPIRHRRYNICFRSLAINFHCVDERKPCEKIDECSCGHLYQRERRRENESNMRVNA